MPRTIDPVSRTRCHGAADEHDFDGSEADSHQYLHRFLKLIRVTYVAVAAKISILLAELKAASMPANSAVKPAAIPIRP
jgi:hypothetical protein